MHPGDWPDQQQLRLAYGASVLRCVGLHPWWVSHQTCSDIQLALEQFAELVPTADGIGEIGLDRCAHFHTPEAQQRQDFAIQGALELSRYAQKPIVLHVVRAHGAILQLLDRWGPFPQGGMVHGFSGSPETAREYLKRGFLISVGLGALKKGYGQLKKTIAILDEAEFLLETDSHEPADLVKVATAVGNLRKTTPEDVLRKSSLNLRRLFEI